MDVLTQYVPQPSFVKTGTSFLKSHGEMRKTAKGTPPKKHKKKKR